MTRPIKKMHHFLSMKALLKITMNFMVIYLRNPKNHCSLIKYNTSRWIAMMIAITDPTTLRITSIIIKVLIRMVRVIFSMELRWAIRRIKIVNLQPSLIKK